MKVVLESSFLFFLVCCGTVILGFGLQIMGQLFMWLLSYFE